MKGKGRDGESRKGNLTLVHPAVSQTLSSWPLQELSIISLSNKTTAAP